MLLATTFVTLPFVVREVVPVLREFGVDQEEVAYTLGAGRWRTFWRVTLPSIRWGLAYGVTLTVARSLGEFGALLVVSGNILGRTQTATLYVHDGIESFNTEGAYAASVAPGGRLVRHADRHGSRSASASRRTRKRVEPMGRQFQADRRFQALSRACWQWTTVGGPRHRPAPLRPPPGTGRRERGHRGAETSRSGSGRSRPSTASRSRSPPASSWRCWARRARARARSCGSSPGWSRPTRARSS